MKKTYAVVLIIVVLGLVSAVAGLQTLKTLKTRIANSRLAAAASVSAGKEKDKPAVAGARVITNVVTMTNIVGNTLAGGDAADLADQLRQRDSTIAQLQRQISEMEAKHHAEIEQIKNDHSRGPGRFVERLQQMEALKTNDPERYAQIKKEEQERTQTAKNVMSDQYNYIYGLDPQGMTEEQLANHNQLMTILGESWKYIGVLESPESKPEDTMQARMVLMRNMMQSTPLFEKERDTALLQMGETMGYNGTEAQQFAEAMKYVYDMTSVRTYFRGFGGRQGATR